MKKSTTIFTIILLAQISFAQQVTVSGTIINPKSNKVYVQYYSNFLDYEEVFADSALLDPAGHFTMTFDWKKANIVSFLHNDEFTEMYLVPGDNLHITLDTEEFDESIAYRGDGSVINTYLALATLHHGYPDGSTYSLGEIDYLQAIDSIRADWMVHFEQYFSGIPNINDPDIKHFMELEKKRMLYAAADLKLLYPVYYAFINKQEEKVNTSENFDQFLDGLPIYDESMMESIDYVSFLNDYLDYMVNKNWKLDTTQQWIEVKKKFIDAHFPENFQPYAYAQVAYDFFSRVEIEKGIAAFEKYKSITKDNEYTPLLEELLITVSKLTAGKPAPDFTLEDVNGKQVSLRDFEGKIVYLDFWATWCGPCMRELPHLEKLMEALKGKDVVFLGISFDGEEEAWKTMVREKNLQGVHVIAHGGFRSEVAESYNIIGIPQYYIVDRDGKIAVANAERPSGDVKGILEKLLSAE